jgi:TonB-linked SusC/RagA family outer membrane protein
MTRRLLFKRKLKILQAFLPTLLCFFALLLPLLAAAQNALTIKGKITDNKGTGVPGISVGVKNTSIGTATDAGGNYEVSALLKNGNYTLLVSGAGYKTQEKSFTVSGTAPVELSVTIMPDVLGLDEVVVTGTSAGTTRKQLGNYVGTVKGSQIANSATGNALAALQGKVAGAQITQNSGDPAGGMSVKLRGISTIGSGSDPLYIVDGVIINNASPRVTNADGNYDAAGAIGQNRMVDINPNDIDRIEVLNGAAAAAIYGSRANAGVVQIFTKRGSTGAPQITFTTRLTTSSLRKRLTFSKAATKFGGPTDGVGAITQDILTPSLTTTTPVTRYDYQDDIFRTGIGTDNSISIAGGKDRTKYYTSINYFHNQGIIKNTDNSRYSIKVNIDQGINKWMTINTGLNYIYNSTNEKPDGNTFYSPLNTMTILGNFHKINNRDANGNLQAVGERGRINPISVIDDIKQKNITSRLISNVGVKLSPYKGLTIDYTMGIDNISQNGTTLVPPYTYNANPAFWGGGTTIDAAQNGYASAASYRSFFINHDVNVTYNTQLISKLFSTTQLGYSEQYEKADYLLAQSRGLAIGVQTVNGGSTLLPSADSRSEQSIRGYFIQQNFKWDNKFFVTVAGRIDGSSVFDKKNRNQFYPKVSTSYSISDTRFFKNLYIDNVVSSFKIRAAYGESGNLTGIGAFDRFNTYGAASYLGRNSLTTSLTRANDNIVPERQKEFEIGTDAAFFNNRMQLTLNVYSKKVVDLIVPNLTIAPSTGFANERKNVGSLRNSGIEILLSGTPVKKDNFVWGISLNYAKNRNKVLDISSPLITFSSGTGAFFALIPGYDAPVFYSTYFARDAAGNQLLNPAGIPVIERGNAAGVPQRDPATGLPYTTGPNSNVLRKVLGSPNPDFTATIINTVTIKKLTLGFQIDMVRGNEVFNADFRTRQGVGNGSEFAEKEHNGQIPRGFISGIYAIEEWRIDDGSFTKLRELSLSYDFGKVGKVFNGLTVSLAGRNLISWDNYKGYDPETNATGQSSLLRGIDFGNVPIPRTFQLGVTAKF